MMMIPLIAAALAVAAPPADTLRYTVLLGTQAAGTQVVWREPDGSTVARYTYRDRERGPDVTHRFAPGAGGVPARVEVTGHDYLRNRVDERFAAPDSGFYLSLYGAPQQTALLARALRDAPGHRLRLASGGEVRAERGAPRVVAAGVRADTVTPYAITGLLFVPLTVWLDGRGELFAQGDARASAVRAGWEEVAPSLWAAQGTASSERGERIARTLARPDAEVRVLRNARVLDVQRGRIADGRAVVIRAGRIAWVGPDAKVRVPAGAEEVDLRGRVLMPGMWDMHVHLREEHLLPLLAAGVTSVRDMGNVRAQLDPIRRRLADGAAVGPRVVAAGMVDGPGPFAGPGGLLVSTPGEARAAVDTLAAHGYAQVKVYSSLSPALLPVVIRAAHARGMRVGGHVPAFTTAEHMVRMGADELNHVNFLLLNFWADSVPDTRTLARMTSVAERGGSFDPRSPAFRRFVRLLRDRNVVIDPTLNVFERVLEGRKGTPYPGFEGLVERLPFFTRSELLIGGLPVADEAAGRRSAAAMDTLLAVVRELHTAGVPLVIGTDGLYGFSYARELELRVRAGIPARHVLRAATLGAARLMGMHHDLGTIAPGKLADLVVIDGDPLARIADVRRVDLVIRDGRLYDRADLLRAADIAP